MLNYAERHQHRHRWLSFIAAAPGLDPAQHRCVQNGAPADSAVSFFMHLVPGTDTANRRFRTTLPALMALLVFLCLVLVVDSANRLIFLRRREGGRI